MSSEWQLLYYRQDTYEDQMQINADLLGDDLRLGEVMGSNVAFRVIPPDESEQTLWVCWAVERAGHDLFKIANFCYHVDNGDILFLHSWHINYDTYMAFRALFSGDPIEF
jgi:hypothetical protein